MLANTSECLLPSPWHCSLARKVSVSSLVVSGVGAGRGLWTLSLGKEKRWERETLTRAHPQLFPHTPRYGSSRGQRKVWEKRICIHSFRAWSALGGSWAEPPHTTVPSWDSGAGKGGGVLENCRVGWELMSADRIVKDRGR